MVPLAVALLASNQARWLAARQKVIAENVAQSDTPGFRASDLAPFSDMINKTSLGMSATNMGHMAEGVRLEKASARKEAASWDVSHSGNNVSVEQQMLKANEVHRAYALNTAITRAFARMMSASVKG